MCMRNIYSKMGKPAGDDHAVSEVVGNVLLLGIIILAIGLLLLTGTKVFDNARSSATLNGVEQAFTMADSRLSKARYSSAIYQEAPFEVSSGIVTVNGSWDDSHIIVMDYDNVAKTSAVIYNMSLGTIKCDTGNGIVAYQDGGVWLLDRSGGSVVLSPPDFDYNGVTMTLPITRINGNSSLATAGGTKTIINVNSTDLLGIYPGAAGYNPLPQNHTINITIKSDYYLAWADYFHERTDALVAIDAKNKSVNISLITGTGKQSGLADNGYNTKSMDATYNAPVVTFVLDLYLRNSGNDYTVTYRVTPTGHTDPDPDFQISVTRVTGQGNKDYDYNKTYFKQGSQIEVFDTYDWFQRKSDDEIYMNLLNRSLNLTYRNSGSSQSITWGDNSSTFDYSTNPKWEFVDPWYKDVNVGENKSIYDVIEHYMKYMAAYDQAHGSALGGPQYFPGSNSEYKYDHSSTFLLEYLASQDIKYMYITEGTLNTYLASSG
jgi:hypothetical protein